jgi:hypothetical protein
MEIMGLFRKTPEQREEKLQRVIDHEADGFIDNAIDQRNRGKGPELRITVDRPPKPLSAKEYAHRLGQAATKRLDEYYKLSGNLPFIYDEKLTEAESVSAQEFEGPDSARLVFTEPSAIIERETESGQLLKDFSQPERPDSAAGPSY